jgi:phosphohistidine phosphatase SixA
MIGTKTWSSFGFAVVCALAMLAPIDLPIRAAESDEPTIVFVVRHAEKQTEHGDLELSDAGRKRGAALAALLEHAGVTHLYATQYRRTRSTLGPLAQAVGVELTVVDSGALDEQLRILKGLPGGSVAVVAGHSNTVPAIVRGLGGSLSGTQQTEHGEMIDSDAYDRLFAVVLANDETALELRFGR